MTTGLLKGVRAIAFDVGGTLYVCPEFDALVEGQAYAALAAARNCSIEDARELLRAQRADNAERYGDTSKVRALESLGVPHGTFQDAAAALDPSKFLADAQSIGQLLAAIGAMGIRIGILSNFKEILVRKVFDCLAADWDQVDASVCVEDGLPIKPSPVPFRALCERLGVEPEHTVFVGDSVSKDLRPAKHLGMTTVLVESGEPDGDLSVVDFRVTTADAVLDLLER